MADEAKEQTTPKSPKSSKSSKKNAHGRERSKTKKKLDEMAEMTLIMSGLKTEKERNLAKLLEGQIKKTNQQNSDYKTLNTKYRQLEQKYAAVEKKAKKSRDTVYKEQKLRTSAVSDQQRIKAVMQKIQLAVSARLKLLGIDFENITSIGEALDASLKAINSLVAQLQEKDELIEKMQKEMDSLKDTVEQQKKKISDLEKKLAKEKKLTTELKKKLQDKDKKVDSLNFKNKELEKKNKALQDELDKLKAAFEKFKAETDAKFNDMAKKLLAAKEENVAKQSKIDDLLKQIEDLRATLKDRDQTIRERDDKIRELEAIIVNKNKEIEEKNNKIQELLDEIERLKKIIEELRKLKDDHEKTMNDQSEKIAELEKIIVNKNDELEEKNKKIASLNDEIAALKKEIERLLAIINKPKASTHAQTRITGDIDQQLSDYPRLLKEIVALKALLDKKNKRIRDLEEENKMLMADLTYLLKKAVAFYSDRGNHTGQVWAMKSAPSRYLVATGSTDMSVRIWRINPEPDKSKGQKATQPIKCSRIDGKIDSLCWSKDGKLLGAGTGYRDGADGFVVVWSMDGKSQYQVSNAIRSRPTLRFGRTYALCFSPDARFIYCGDTVGSVWCINLESERIVGLIQNHKDIVYDVITNKAGDALYSVSLDKTLAVIILPEECGGVKGVRDQYLALNSDGPDSDEKKDDNDNKIKGKKSKGGAVKDIKGRKSTKGSKKSKKGGKSSKNKHIRARSQSQAKKPLQEKKFSSMTLKELLDQNMDDEYKTYDGITIVKDDSYGFWKVCISSDDQYVICATRKVQIFRITGRGTVEAAKDIKISDMDNDHIKSLNIRNKIILTSRAGCSRAKFFDINDGANGKELKKVSCKKTIAQCAFLCDDSYAAILQQELIPNQQPKPPSMKLVQYKKDGKKPITNEPQTPRATGDE